MPLGKDLQMATAAPRRPGDTGRLLLIFGTPIAYAALSFVHPHSGNDADIYGLLRNQWVTWLGVHVVQIILIILLGATVWALLGVVDHRELPSSLRWTRMSCPTWTQRFEIRLWRTW